MRNFKKEFDDFRKDHKELHKELHKEIDGADFRYWLSGNGLYSREYNNVWSDKYFSLRIVISQKGGFKLEVQRFRI